MCLKVGATDRLSDEILRIPICGVPANSSPGSKHASTPAPSRSLTSSPTFGTWPASPIQGNRARATTFFDAFLDHCESRKAKNDLAPITLSTYRRVLDHFWRPKLGRTPLLAVRYSMLARIADQPGWKKKTYNNAISAQHVQTPAVGELPRLFFAFCAANFRVRQHMVALFGSGNPGATASTTNCARL